jgi:PAS domain S-box-containing protein
VRGKLLVVVLGTTAIAMLVAGVAMLTNDLSVYRQSWALDLSTEASIIAVSAAPALLFDDRNGAERNLAALRARPAVLAAALYDTHGNLYAQYVRQGEAPASPQLQPAASISEISGERVEFAQPIVQNGETLGTIYLRARYDVWGRVRAYLGIFALVTALSMCVALVASRSLQEVITEPLDAMANVARQIVHRRDYSLRVRETSRDEIGLVIEAFNRMLDEVQVRALALEQSNAALKTEVDTRQAAETALGRANARLESTMAAAEIGSWVRDLRTNEFTADRNLAALYGLADEKALNGDPTLHHRQIHPDDLPAVIDAEAQALRGGVFASTEFRITWADGSVRWMARRGKVQLDAAGKPIFIAGLLIDITAQKKAEQALRDSEKLYRAIGESIDYGVWVCAPDGRNIYTSDSFLRLMGITQEQCADFGWADHLHPDDAAGTLEAWRACVRQGSVWYREHRILGTDGRYHPILAQGVATRGEDGRISGWAGINLDISRLKRTEDALREADRRKDEFLATLAHELRNPLAPIRNAVKLLDESVSDERQRQWGREVIARQAQRMALLLDDLLDVSRITRGRLDLKKGQVDLATLIASAVETARPLIETKRQTLDILPLPEGLRLEVDPLRLSQALSNLLTNAAKYTDAEGHITLRVSLQDAELIMTVTDTGIGLDPGAIPNLFEMFSQVDSAIDRAEGGLGIGLALVKGLIALHGGTVEVESRGLGFGSEFTIRLPRTVIVPAQAQTNAEIARANPQNLRRCKVLVTDDNRDAADSLALILEMSGFNALVAHSGRQALDLCERESPEAVILDIGMPDMNGYEVARVIRSEAWGRETFLLAITGWGQKNDKERAKSAGFDHHLTKPVDADQVEQLLTSFLISRHGSGLTPS